MNKKILLVLLFIPIQLVWSNRTRAQESITKNFIHPTESAKPWAFWYWMKASVPKAGIKADLEAMKSEGIGGAYLMPIEGKPDSLLIKPAVVQLSPLWWKMVKYAFHEADSLGLKLAMHDCDGFATAGGPWITPALSMQKVVWSEVNIKKGGNFFDSKLPQPETNDGYYRDIAVYAYPSLPGTGKSTNTIVPIVTTNQASTSAQYLANKNNKRNFVSNKPCWIQYAFKKPFTCRSITIRVHGANEQAHRLLVETSNDGTNFHKVERLKPARNGWEDYLVKNSTYSIKPMTARYFRFVYNPEGTEPGAEDLDAAKWSPKLKLCGIELFSKPQINQFEGKNSSVWRISSRTTASQIPDSLCVPLDKIINISRYMDANGHLRWDVPPGKWTILRIGHTTTGQENTTGGGGKGLECDKFNPVAVKIQFNHWFGEVFKKVGNPLASQVLKIFHVDSWECGSQNWSPVFHKEFRKLRGYNLLPYLPVMAGVPVQSTNVSERVLYDVRHTIAQLLDDNFFKTMSKLAHEKGCLFSSESVAPTMESDAILHYNQADIPMGEFWLRSPTHDKPNDIFDAVSGGHIYGRRIIQAESFTELREEWDEYPEMLKPLADLNYSFGINRMVYHVFVENPWPNREPGMTLGGIGTYFQRNQTWWKPGRAWVQYARRCQTLLQEGRSVDDIAVFTGEEIPRRAVLPDRLLSVLPGIFGKKLVRREKKRLANVGEPLQKIPAGLKVSANITKAPNWVNPLHGYAYDSINEDGLLRLASFHDGRITLPDGASYALLVIPGKRRMQPEGNLMSLAVAERLLKLVKSGATILLCDQPRFTPGFENYRERDQKVQQIGKELLDGKFERIKTNSGSFLMKKLGKGRILKGPFHASSFDAIGLYRDFIALNSKEKYANNIAWTHRTLKGEDIYFIANQEDSLRTVTLSLRVKGRIPWLYNAVTNDMRTAGNWKIVNCRTVLPIRLQPYASVFVILKQPAGKERRRNGTNWSVLHTEKVLKGPWKVHFDNKLGGPEDPVVFSKLEAWSQNSNSAIKFYSGTAQYQKKFFWNPTNHHSKRIWLDLGKVKDIAAVRVNGKECGVAWTYPYCLDITNAVKSGENTIDIAVTNTWRNRLIGDHKLPKDKRMTWTTVPYRILEGKPLTESGLLGPVKICVSTN